MLDHFSVISVKYSFQFHKETLTLNSFIYRIQKPLETHSSHWDSPSPVSDVDKPSPQLKMAFVHCYADFGAIRLFMGIPCSWKLDDLSTSHEFVLKHSSALTKNLTELEGIQSKPDEMTIKTIKERSTVYKITMLAVINACQEFINLSRIQTRKMQKVLQSEREMRTK